MVWYGIVKYGMDDWRRNRSGGTANQPDSHHASVLRLADSITAAYAVATTQGPKQVSRTRTSTEPKKPTTKNEKPNSKPAKGAIDIFHSLKCLLTFSFRIIREKKKKKKDTPPNSTQLFKNSNKVSNSNSQATGKAFHSKARRQLARRSTAKL